MNPRYCPVCGYEILSSFEKCTRCKTNIPVVEALHDEKYYRDVAIKKYGYDWDWFKRVLYYDEIIKNPHFNQRIHDELVKKAHDIAVEAFKKMDEKRILEEKTKNIPKCPTCGSTNISKISGAKKATHAIMFGIFNRTANSQFECKNCGYKW